jgi:RDD family protein
VAGVGARFVARVIDVLAVLGLNAAVNGWFVYKWWQVNEPFWREFSRRFAAGQSTSGLEAPAEGSTLMIVILILATALWFAYEVPAHAGNGQTVGKRLNRIKVMRLESTEPLGFGRAMRRWNPLGLPTLLWTCFGIGFVLQIVDCLWVAIDRPLHQALHDKSAVTVVVDIGQSRGEGPA